MQKEAKKKSAPIISIDALIYDCDNPEELAIFYAKLLGGYINADPYGGYSLKIPDSDIMLAFQHDEHYQRPVWLGKPGQQQPMAHLDLKVQDRVKAVEYALSIGAERPDEQFCQPEWDVQWTMLFDPAGHPFCLWEMDHEEG